MNSAQPLLLAQGLLQDPGAAALVIGVTGHRDPRPETVPVVRENTRLQLRQLMAALPHTPLVMLNGMAAGIDTEIAEEFLEVVELQRSNARPTQPLPRHQLVATLPKIPDDFRRDFEGDATGLQRFEALLPRADAVLHPGNCQELRIPPLPPGTPPAAPIPPPMPSRGCLWPATATCSSPTTTATTPS